MTAERHPILARRRELGGALLVLGIASALFAFTVRHGFAFDDVSEIVRNEHVRSLRNLGRIFASGAWEGAGEQNPIYRPLTSVTYALNYAIGGLSPAGYHAVNVALHAVVSALVVALGLRLGLSAAAATAAGVLFAVHPVHVEVVANVAGRKDALATLFTICFVLAHRAAVRRRGAWLALAPVTLAAALFSKETGAAGLPLVVAFDVLLGRDASRERRARSLALYAVYLGEFALYLWARHAAVGSFGVPLAHIPLVENPLPHVAAAPRILTAVAVLGRGLWLQVFPGSLSPDYSYDAIPLVQGPADPGFLLAAASIAAVAAAVSLALRRWPAGAFLAAWYAVAILPASNLVFRVGTIFGERLLYLPSVASCLLAGALLDAPPVRHRARQLALAATAMAALVLAARAASYASAWSDEVSLFTVATRAQPRSAKAHQLLGSALMEEDRYAAGIRELETAVAILESLPKVPPGPRVQLGVAYERAGRAEDAARVYEGILRAEPDYPDALWRLGVVRWTEGRRVDAAALWNRTITVAPDHARALTDLGLAAQASGDVSGAETLWLRAVRQDPRAPGAWLALGNLYERRGDAAAARAAWQRFVDAAGYGAYARQREVILQRLRETSSPVAEDRPIAR